MAIATMYLDAENIYAREQLRNNINNSYDNNNNNKSNLVITLLVITR